MIVGLALLIKEDVHMIFEESAFVENRNVTKCLNWLNANISNFQLRQGSRQRKYCRLNLASSIGYLKSISNALGHNFDECFELAYQEIKDRKGRWIDGSFVKEEDLPNETKI